MNPILYAHIPGLKIDQPDIACAGGRLVKLPFQKWLELESEFEYADLKYDKVEPVFWIRDLMPAIDASPRELVSAANSSVWPLHLAFLLDSKAPLMPTPELSCMYIALPTPTGFPESVLGATIRSIGPMEREYIVYDSPIHYAYRTGDLAAVEDLHHLLVETGSRDWKDEVRAGLEALEETARPDSWYGGDRMVCHLHGFVRCMTAMEALLLPPEEGRGSLELGLTFARHAAVLLGDTVESRRPALDFFTKLYRFRSELMHGRTLPSQEDEAVAGMLGHGRQLLRYTLGIVLAMRHSHPDGPPLWETLQEAWENPDRQGAFFRRLRAGVGA